MVSLIPTTTLSTMIRRMGKKVATAAVKRLGNTAIPRPVVLAPKHPSNKHTRGELKKPASSRCVRPSATVSSPSRTDKMRAVALDLLTPGSRANTTTVSELADLFAAVGLSPDVEMPDVDADAEMSGVDKVPATTEPLSSSIRKVLHLAEKAAAATVCLEEETPQAPIMTSVPHLQDIASPPYPAPAPDREIVRNLSPFYVFGKLGWNAVEEFQASCWNRNRFAGHLTAPAPVWETVVSAHTMALFGETESLASSPSSMSSVAASVASTVATKSLASSPSSTSSSASSVAQPASSSAPSKRKADYDGADTMNGRKQPTRT